MKHAQIKICVRPGKEKKRKEEGRRTGRVFKERIDCPYGLR
jgi:hypothetical protein